MTPTVRGILITIAVAFAAGFAGHWVGKAVFHPDTRVPNLHEDIHTELNLTAEQTQRIDKEVDRLDDLCDSHREVCTKLERLIQIQSEKHQ